MARFAAGFDPCFAYLGIGAAAGSGGGGGEMGSRGGACGGWSGLGGLDGFWSADRGSNVLLRGLVVENAVKDVCARRPCALSDLPPGTKMKSCQGRSTPASALWTSHSGLTTFICLKSRTLAGVREQVMMCVLFAQVQYSDEVSVESILRTRGSFYRYRLDRYRRSRQSVYATPEQKVLSNR